MKKTLTIIIGCLIAIVSNAQSPVHLKKIGGYSTNAFDQGGAEISAYDEHSKRLFLVNGGTGNIEIVDISTPSMPFLVDTIDLSPWGIGANSVAVRKGVLVAAVENYNKQDNGFAVFFDENGQYLKHVTIGALPDMITFTPNGKFILVANEGEPNAAYTNDPNGTVSIIEYPNVNGVKQSKVWTLNFSAYNNALPAGIKINGPGSTVAQDMEPEYIAVSDDSKFAYVTLQENNAIAKIDIKQKNIVSLKSLGYKNHNIAGNGMDASDQNGGIVNITTWPVFGMYQPDAIQSFKTHAGEFLIMANEGDVREYTGFAEAKRISTLTLDSIAFPNYASLKSSSKLGRLNVTKSLGDYDNDGDYDSLFAFGARSFSIRDMNGNLIWDSGDFLEQKTFELFPEVFNCSNTNNTKKNRSDDKGPEPEGITTAEILDSMYAFVGLERIGGVMVFNITDPYAPYFVEYKNTRNFLQVPALNAGGDLGPEGMLFIEDKDSPNGKNLLITSNEISGTIAIFETDYACSHDKVEICYNGVAQCVHVNMVNNYLQNGAVYGNCNPLRIGGAEQTANKTTLNATYEAGRNNLSIRFDEELSGSVNISLIDISGRKVFERELTLDNQKQVDIEALNLKQGVYMVSVISSTTNMTKKLFISNSGN